MPIEMLTDTVGIYRCPLCNSSMCNRLWEMGDMLGEDRYESISESELMAAFLQTTTECGLERAFPNQHSKTTD